MLHDACRQFNPQEPIGLEHIPGYKWKVLGERADHWYLPHSRCRLYIVGLRDDVGGEKVRSGEWGALAWSTAETPERRGPWAMGHYWTLWSLRCASSLTTGLSFE